MEIKKYPLASFGPQYANSKTMIDGIAPDPHHAHWIPKLKPRYYWNAEKLTVMLNFLGQSWSQGGEDGLHIIGPTSAGKTSLPEQVCARLNAPLVSVTAHAHMEVSELISTMQLIDGKTKPMDGFLTMAMRHGYVFVLNEIDYLDPGTAAGLNDIIERRFVMIPGTNEVVHAAKGFAFICTSNTNGSGDETGMYVGTQVQNMALTDRLQKLYIDYVEEDPETEMLRQIFPKAEEKVLRAYVEVANLIRGQFLEGSLSVTMSPRALIRWIRLTGVYKNMGEKGKTPVHFAMGVSLTNGSNEKIRTTVHQIVTQVFGVTETC